MKKIKSLVAVSLALCMVLCFAGCSSNHDEGNLKDNLVNGFNNWLESFSKHAVTKDKNLQGERENDIDQYTGSYTASYDGFNGEEFIFGGTALERDNGSNLFVDNYIWRSHSLLAEFWRRTYHLRRKRRRHLQIYSQLRR